MPDVPPLTTKFSLSWALLADKSCQGIQEIIQGTHLKKESKKDHLSQSDMVLSKNVSSDRVIVENFFCRLEELWKLLLCK